MLRLLFLFLALCLTSGHTLLAQDIRRLIAAVKQKQMSLQTLTYTMKRTDTLVTGTVRHLSGQTQLRVDRSDRLVGYWFRSRQDGVAGEVIYDGRLGYRTDDSSRTYTLLTNPDQIRQLLNQPGGQLIMPDLVNLDTTKATRWSLAQDSRFYQLTLHYDDLTEYDVTNRFKCLSIDKTTLLPTSIRQHQETLGNVQDLFYQITSLTLNDPLPASTFQEPPFLSRYQQRTPTTNRAKAGQRLVGITAPAFTVASLEKDSVSSASFLGKVTLLDFWEVWCGPCLASLPKVAQLAQKYASKGLQVYGITHETNQLDVARKLLQKRGINFRTLIGNAQLREAYKLEAIPLYVVVDRFGKIALIKEGFTSDIEATIITLLDS